MERRANNIQLTDELWIVQCRYGHFACFESQERPEQQQQPCITTDNDSAHIPIGWRLKIFSHADCSIKTSCNLSFLSRVTIGMIVERTKSAKMSTHKCQLCYVTSRIVCNIIFLLAVLPILLLDSHTVSVRALCNGRRVCRLSVPRQISKTKRDRREISSHL